jgi:hypothetical protein
MAWQDHADQDAARPALGTTEGDVTLFGSCRQAHPQPDWHVPQGLGLATT